MNKLVFILALTAALFAVMPLFAVSFQLEITSVHSDYVLGDLTITNSSASPVTWDFPSSGQFEIWVDGVSPDAGYFDILTSLTVPANSTIIVDVSHNTSTPYTIGTHTAQARFVRTGNSTAGAPVTFQRNPTAADDPLQISPPPLQLSYGPNPFHDNVQLSFGTKAPVTLSIYNHKGQLVKAVNATETYTWDGLSSTGEACAKGIYYLKAQQGKNSVTRKLIRL